MSTIDGMILTNEDRSTQRKAYPSATLSNTNPTWSVPESLSPLRVENKAINSFLEFLKGILHYTRRTSGIKYQYLSTVTEATGYPA
jgi:hypothetical protein